MQKPSKSTDKPEPSEPKQAQDQAHKHPSPPHHMLVNFVIIGVLLGLIIFALYRVISYTPDEHTHYHANLAIYHDGVQDKLAEPTFYQEIITCSTHEEATTLHRTHLHENIYDVVHVHDDTVSWGQFFENIGSNIDQGYLRIHSKVFTNSGPDKLTIILNGKKIDSLAGLVIGSEDKLLVNYGPETDEVIMQRYAAIENKAKQYNLKDDPLSCSGGHDSSWQDRLWNIFR